MNLHERCIEALSSGVTYIPGSWDKRFVHRAPPVEHMTPAQLYWTVALCYRYRRQITDKDLVSEAAKWLEHNKKP